MGISDGHNPFIRIGNTFYRLRLKNGEYITRIFVHDAGRGTSGDVNAGVIIAATVMGGIVGGQLQEA